MPENTNNDNNKKDEDKVEELKQRLYATNTDVSGHRETTLSEDEDHHDVASEWEDDGTDYISVKREQEKNKKRDAWVNKLLIISLVFFLAAVGYAAFSLFVNTSAISPENIDIAVSGPISVAAGEETNVEIRITNNNDVTLRDAHLIVEFPENTRSVENRSETITRNRVNLGDIAPGEQKEHIIEAILLGEEGEDKNIHLSLEYRVPDSNAVYQKERNYPIEISAIPISVAIDGPDEINSGNTAEFVINIQSNSEESVENVLLSVDYPFGFSFNSANPSPVQDENVWRLGTIEPGEEREIRLTGQLTGQENEERAFKFNLGLAGASDPNTIDGTFVTYTHNLTIQRPFLGMQVRTNGQLTNDEPYVATGGDTIEMGISWRNNLSSRIANAEIRAQLQQGPFLQEKVSVGNGFFRSSDNVVIWNRRTADDLGSIEAGGSGSVSFSFGLSDTRSIVNRVRNPEVVVDIQMTGGQTGDIAEEVSGNVSSNVTKRIRISTDTNFSSRVLHETGVLDNVGPIPPEVGQETTYTVEWSVSNTVNHVSDARITAQLPAYVEWKGETSPSSASVEYNPVSGELVWDLRDVPAGAGYTDASPMLSFKVGITPSLSQVGTSPPLVTNMSFSGTDEFTDAEINQRIPNENISLDEESPQGSDAVQR